MTTTPALTYWRCPECGETVGPDSFDAMMVFVDWQGQMRHWDKLAPAWLYAYEAEVEQHEARHLTAGAK